MLKKERISEIAKLLKIDETTFVAALASTDEIDVEIPKELTVLTQEELTKRDESVGKLKYNEGKNAAVEMLVKEQKEKEGLEFEGKDPEKLIEALKKKVLVDAKIEPNKKIEELNGVITKLQDNVKASDEEKKTLSKQIEAVKTDSKLLGLLPANRLSILNDEEYLNNFKSSHSIEIEDGKEVVKKGGEILRDKATQAPLEPKDVINQYFTERKWVGETPEDRKGRGAGGDNGKPSVFLKMSELVKDFEGSGKSIQGEEFQEVLNAARTANPNFDMNA